MRLEKGAADRKHVKNHIDFWKNLILREVQVPSSGQSLRASLGIGEPRDRLWPIHAKHGVTCQGVWICSGGSEGVSQVSEVDKLW